MGDARPALVEGTRMFSPDFILKTTPPRVPRTALERESLLRLWHEARERTAITVIAPAGFGKTTLLAQWRRRWLEQGALVAWLGVDAQDNPVRFTMGLLHAVHAASGRPAFDALLTQFATEREHQIEALTGLLAEIAHLGKESVVIIDDAERLPAETAQGALQYLLHNAPPNLHVVIGSRVPLPLQTWELAAAGELAIVGTEALRLQLDESASVLDKRFGQRLDLDQCARLHELTGGWPLGLQLVAATLEREPDLAVAIDSLSARSGDIGLYLAQTLLRQLPEALAAFVIRIAPLEHLNAQLCEAVTGNASAGAYLDALMLETPILSASGTDGWLRLHPLARDFLLGRFELLSKGERDALHARASKWFAQHQRFHEAASHALAAGDEASAHAHAAQALWTLTLQGQLIEAREWLERIPRDVVAGDLDLRLVGAWILAIGERNHEAQAIAQGVLSDSPVNLQRRFFAARAAFTAAAYGDRVGALPELLALWTHHLPERVAQFDDPAQAIAFNNGLALYALHTGDIQRVRQLTGPLPNHADWNAVRLPVAHRQLISALAHLWDGDVRNAETILVPALAAAERSLGRRSMVACNHAALLAAVLLERDQPEAAQALLANRLDVIERCSAPDILLLAYRTLAFVALAQGDERRALLVLGSMASLAEARNLPRVLANSLAEQIRIYALRACSETVEELVRALDALAPQFADPERSPHEPLYRLVVAIAKAHAALARHDLGDAEHQLEIAGALATSTRRARDGMTVKVLRAVVARERNAPNALPLLAEALSLAAIGGYDRLLLDTHPLAVQMAAELRSLPSAPERRPEREPAAQAYSNLPERTLPRSGLLTTKESEILVLLDKGLSNKLIARAMEISDETVKWHIKNLFLKLAAGTRKHAVDRARLLGLLGA
jgi:LuxR family maltose regulon positive regulatory protein